MKTRLLFCFLLFASLSFAQTPAPLAPTLRWQTDFWKAQWIGHPTAPIRAYGVYHFRKSFELAQKPGRFVINVSGDNRYRLFVNGKAVVSGPARSDLQNWNYETVDIAPYLNAGKNTLAAVVTYMAEYAPFAQMNYQFGFIVQGDGDAEQVVNTNNTWKILQNPAYSPVINDIPKLRTYIVIGAGDRVDAARYPWGWEATAFDDAAWLPAKPVGWPAKPRGLGTDGNWNLVPRTIPLMEETPLRLTTVRRAEGVDVDDDFLKGKNSFTVHRNHKAVILLDQGYLTNAFPELTVSRGKDAVVTLAYAEALVDEKRQKGNRNQVEGKQLVGFEDQFIGDGSRQKRTFRPLLFRTYRYLQITIETKGEPLEVHDLIGHFTGYPFQEKARFASSDESLKNIWNVGWRTARLCAGETYYDCPYYEQFQYTGDTRIQSFISLYVTGDDRLMKKAIADFDHSRFNDGLTQSRYPSADFQVIPPFSLYWVSMVYDYWMHRKDDKFVESMMPGMVSVLDWHEKRLATNGLNGPLEWWNFVDWSKWDAPEEGMGGVPKGARKGGSAILTLQQAYTMQRISQLFYHYGKNQQAEHYRLVGIRLAKNVYDRCWDSGRGLMADTPDKTGFSQHANIWAILTDAVPVAQQKVLMQKVMADPSLIQATFYFKFYLFQALKKTGMADQFLPMLKPWHDMLAMGLTTFAENPEPTRSDCHAWSAAPNYEFLSTICGINPASPGFETVVITPYLGNLQFAEGAMPHPAGEIAVRFDKTPTGGLKGTVTLPEGLTGTLKWKGKTLALKEGQQTVSL
ncbi:alpha-L-rhamnosidase N-terminal domain-containing protein [Larkinella terrae]|uniref:Bacterial alpha-L-rhamnosidase n=1 Tax=Larkinella terrae TaxID=2025311 RepID=A0A7K0EFU3_9BACT|nr:family 78 glycoside hydrolase catalytic domain [Larkinella terrae]MRS60697.1 Bacterial alpha-L-rhamnosidase [Larkinella terrae]